MQPRDCLNIKGKFNQITGICCMIRKFCLLRPAFYVENVLKFLWMSKRKVTQCFGRWIPFLSRAPCTLVVHVIAIFDKSLNFMFCQKINERTRSLEMSKLEWFEAHCTMARDAKYEQKSNIWSTVYICPKFSILLTLKRLPGDHVVHITLIKNITLSFLINNLKILDTNCWSMF